MNLIQRIDALLPQTQCGKCGHTGCRPYAAGIAQGEPINRCPPGGQETIAALSQLLHLPVLPLDTARGKAPAQVAYIREAECIGCTKCIQACPVDAIVGAPKLMHSVLIDECTGCDLCVAPCPVDCIELREWPSDTPPIIGDAARNTVQLALRQQKRDKARRRYEQRASRLQRQQSLLEAKRAVYNQTLAKPLAVPALSPLERIRAQNPAPADGALKQARIAVAMSRAQLSKSQKAFVTPPTAEQHAKLARLQEVFEQAEHRLAQLQTVATGKGNI